MFNLLKSFKMKGIEQEVNTSFIVIWKKDVTETNLIRVVEKEDVSIA